jgi:hypothetical protein
VSAHSGGAVGYVRTPLGDAPTTLTYRRHVYAVTARGIERDGEVLTRAELLALDPDGRVWRWLREHGARRPSPSGPSGETARVLGGWRVDPAIKVAVAVAARAAGKSESAWVESAIERELAQHD